MDNNTIRHYLNVQTLDFDSEEKDVQNSIHRI